MGDRKSGDQMGSGPNASQPRIDTDTKNRTLDTDLVEDPTQILSPIQVMAIYRLILKIYNAMDYGNTGC